MAVYLGSLSSSGLCLMAFHSSGIAVLKPRARWDNLHVFDYTTRESIELGMGEEGQLGGSACAFDPRADYVAIGTQHIAELTHDVTVWSTKTGELSSRLTGHTDLVHNIVYAPDGQTLASASDDFSVRVWRADARQSLRVFYARDATLAFSPDGKALAIGNGDEVSVCELATGTWLVRHAGPSAVDLAFLPGGHTITAAAINSIWTLPVHHGGVLRAQQVLTPNTANLLVYGPRSRLLAVGGQDGTVTVWCAVSTRPWSCLAVFDAGGSTVLLKALAFSAAGTTLTAAFSSGVLCQWDVSALMLKARALTLILAGNRLRRLPPELWYLILHDFVYV